MRSGDLVELSGQGLDGRYVVTDGRDAHAGEDAFTATSDMDAQVILQTCYPGTGGRERLIGLEPQN
jgi:sortase (surface protein transpeptidase)